MIQRRGSGSESGKGEALGWDLVRDKLFQNFTPIKKLGSGYVARHMR